MIFFCFVTSSYDLSRDHVNFEDPTQCGMGGNTDAHINVTLENLSATHHVPRYAFNLNRRICKDSQRSSEKS